MKFLIGEAPPSPINQSEGTREANVVSSRQVYQRLKKKHAFWIISALGPTILLFMVIRVYPILNTIYLSFYRYHPTRRNNPFVGLRNYQRLLEDAAFQTALANTGQITILAVVITLSLALLFAISLRSIDRASTIYEIIFYIPVVTPWVPTSVVWKWIYDPIYGILNYFLSLFGIAKQSWLLDPNIVLYAVTGVAVWKLLGYFIIIYGVGLKNIPETFLEAAEIDGASFSQRLVYIILPLLKPVILFTVVMSTIMFFNIFALVYVLTSSAQGAPAYDLKVAVLEIYRSAFVYYRMGYAGAQSVTLLVFVMFMIFMHFYVFKER